MYIIRHIGSLSYIIILYVLLNLVQFFFVNPSLATFYLSPLSPLSPLSSPLHPPKYMFGFRILFCRARDHVKVKLAPFQDDLGEGVAYSTL